MMSTHPAMQTPIQNKHHLQAQSKALNSRQSVMKEPMQKQRP